MAGESISRLIHPLPIQFNQAIVVACLGLAVNVTSAWILKDQHHHHHHNEEHEHHHHHDLNLRSAYLHVIADAFTSVLAIMALVSGKLFGWYWMDAIMGLIGSAVIGQWAYSLIRQTTVILLDREPEDSDLNYEIRKAIESDADAVIADLHIWQVGMNKFAAIVSLVAHESKSPEFYKSLLRQHKELIHVTVEINRCETESVALVF